MGITIFATGKIDRIEDIAILTEELRKLAEINGWQYRVMDDDFATQPNAVLTYSKSETACAGIEGSLGLKGIVLTVGQRVEHLPILFDASGVLTDVMQQLSWISDRQSPRFIMCKTQFRNIDAHVRIVEVLDLLKKKYISDLSVTDEGDYWQTRDSRILAEKRIHLGKCMRRAEKTVESIEMTESNPRDAESIASRIEDAFLKEAEQDNDSHQEIEERDFLG